MVFVHAHRCRDTFGGRGKGKSGGCRVITFFSGADVPVFLLNIFAKGERANLSKAEVNALRTILGRIVEAYQGKDGGR
jgi:hypothetical protein